MIMHFGMKKKFLLFFAKEEKFKTEVQVQNH